MWLAKSYSGLSCRSVQDLKLMKHLRFVKKPACLSQAANSGSLFRFFYVDNKKESTKASSGNPPIKTEKKDVSGPYPDAYHPKNVEQGWYEWWEENGLFVPEILLKSEFGATGGPISQNDFKYDMTSEAMEFCLMEKQKLVPKHAFTGADDSNTFCMVLPPPNVTGNLHLGHTLTVAIQDSIARWHRMNGDVVLWVPGYDHGGIATQTIVEKKMLQEKKKTKHELGRENFLEEIMEWKTITQEKITEQLKKIGASLDFGRSTFTMDSNASEGVTKAFVQLFEENFIYRKEKMVNWSCAIRSVISDIEVDHLEVPGTTKIRVPDLDEPVEVGSLEIFCYPVVDSKEKISIGTTRLETMLGDMAVAVHPEDSRYSNLIGKFVKHPFTQELLPIIADESINKNFCSGAMKVTPAHDFKDFELGQKHNLTVKDILCDDGTIKEDIDVFGGKQRFVARQLVRDALSQMGLYLEKRSHSMSVPVCSRTGDIIEPRLKAQWYLNCQAMGAQAVKVVEEGKLKLTPKHHEKVWFEWFKHLQDWCISRQLWWGHKIPVYKILSSEVQGSEVWVAAKNVEEAIAKGSKKLSVDVGSVTAIQDQDVLDTWFSSALFPLTALGWPNTVDDLNRFYPLSLMETGYDIIFFWVARMVMLGHHLTGKLPFNEVLLHGMICDAYGRKMTKSLGNIIDPLDIIQGISLKSLCERVHHSHQNNGLTPEELELSLNSQKRTYPSGIPECGTDGLRFALLSHDIQHQRINIDVKEIHTCRHFCNKIWQGVRFFTKVIEECAAPEIVPLVPSKVSVKELPEVSQWILSRLSNTVTLCNNGFSNYEFHIATSSMRHFWVQNFCDIYLEYVKPVLASGEKEDCQIVCQVMITCIETFLRCLSPFMPFLTEELYQRLMLMTCIQPFSSISLAPYPKSDDYSSLRNTVLEAEMSTVMDLVNISRKLKTEHGATKIRPNVTIAVDGENTLTALQRFGPLIATLARLNGATFHLTQGHEHLEHLPQDSLVSEAHEHGITVIMDIEGDVNIQGNVDSRFNSVCKELDKLSKLISDAGYRKKAPHSVRERNLAKKAILEAELQKLLNRPGKLESESAKEDASSPKDREHNLRS